MKFVAADTCFCLLAYFTVSCFSHRLCSSSSSFSRCCLSSLRVSIKPNYTLVIFTNSFDRGTIKNEWQNGLKNKFGSVAMARLGGQADSATSQFFINVKDNDFLDSPNDGSAYAVFGHVSYRFSHFPDPVSAR